MNLTSKLLGGAGAALMVAAFAAPAQAQTTPLYSGGGTLAEKVYRDIFNCYGNRSPNGTTPNGDLTIGLVGPQTTCNTATPYRSNVEALYVGVGSGNGKKALNTHDASQYTSGGRIPDAVPVPSTSDFGPFYGTGTGAGWVRGTSNPFPKVSFTGSDDPLTPADITAYKAASGWNDASPMSGSWGAPIQVPAFVTTVTVPFNPTAGWTPKNKVLAGGSSAVNLSTNTLCGIFTGAINNWNHAAITADNKNVQLGSGPITVIYRSDGSGTTFLFTNALIHQCGSQSAPRAGITFNVPDQWLADNGIANPAGDPDHIGDSNNNFYINVNTAGHKPANFTGASGSGGVQSAIAGTVGATGYLSPDFVAPVVPGGLVTANLQSYASLLAGTKVWKPATPKTGTGIMSALKAPLFTAASCPVGTAVGQAADGICAHNPLNWGKTNPMPTSTAAYPIGGFTFIDTYTCYASAADVDAIAGKTVGALGLWTWWFSSPTINLSIVKNELTANGFSVVPGSWLSGAKKLFTSDVKTKVATPGTAKSPCTTVVGGA
jgi:ABC-type phosphate transport system substrate-binding protein